jgi:membrane protease subunit HflC
MEAERSAIANEYRALGREEADKIKSQADREKSDIIANAYKQAQIIKGEGDARSAEIYAEAHSQAPEFFKMTRTLEAYKKMLRQQAVVVMSADSDLLKYLNGVPLSGDQESEGGR